MMKIACLKPTTALSRLRLEWSGQARAAACRDLEIDIPEMLKLPEREIVDSATGLQQLSAAGSSD